MKNSGFLFYHYMKSYCNSSNLKKTHLKNKYAIKEENTIEIRCWENKN